MRTSTIAIPTTSSSITIGAAGSSGTFSLFDDWYSNKNATYAVKKKNSLPGYYEVGGKKFYIKTVLYNDPVTVVFWSDGTKTISKCHGEDTYNKEAGLAICVLKKLTSSSATYELLNEWVMDKKYVEIKDVRDARKKNKVDSEVSAPSEEKFSQVNKTTKSTLFGVKR